LCLGFPNQTKLKLPLPNFFLLHLKKKIKRHEYSTNKEKNNRMKIYKGAIQLQKNIHFQKHILIIFNPFFGHLNSTCVRLIIQNNKSSNYTFLQPDASIQADSSLLVPDSWSLAVNHHFCEIKQKRK